MGLTDTILSDTVGVVWRGVSGTVDPWSKQEVICCVAAACVAAQGITPDDPDYCLRLADAKAKAATSTSTVLSQDNACPNNFKDGVYRSVTGQNLCTKNLMNKTVCVGKSPLAKYATWIGLGLLAVLLILHFIDREV